LTLGLVNAVLTASVFTGVLWSVGGGLTFAVGGLLVTVPGYLVIGAVLYALLFTGLMLVIGRNLPAVIQLQSQSEAEFLAAANEVRESGNHAASDGDRERQRAVWDALSQVLLRWRQLLWQLMGTTFVSQTDLLFAPVFGWFLCVPKYLAGSMTLGELTQAAAAFTLVQSSFNWLVDNFNRVADWVSSLQRVGGLLLALDRLDHGFSVPDRETTTAPIGSVTLIE